MSFKDDIKELSNVDIFQDAKKKETFIGRSFYIDYNSAFILIADSWKKKAGGIPQGSLLLAFYENEKDVKEAMLLRALKPTNLPTDYDMVSSMIEYYKDDLQTSGSNNKLDDFTRYEFSFSGFRM